MILPTKHLAPDRALLTMGGEILEILADAKTVSQTWEDFQDLREKRWPAQALRFEWFVLALDLLFALDVVHLGEGRLHRRSA